MELKAGDTGPELRSRATEDASSPSDVRKWQEGDVLKKVHWKLTMRRRELMVRTFEESSRPDTLIVPDLSEIQALPDQALTIEDCVCEACLSQARAQLNEGYPVRMPLLSARPGEPCGQFPQDFPMFAEALMRVKFDSPFPYEQVLLQMLRRTTRTGGCVLVTPRLTTRVADMALKLSRTGVRVRLLWVTDSRNDQSLEMVERFEDGKRRGAFGRPLVGRRLTEDANDQNAETSPPAGYGADRGADRRRRGQHHTRRDAPEGELAACLSVGLWRGAAWRGDVLGRARADRRAFRADGVRGHGGAGRRFWRARAV